MLLPVTSRERTRRNETYVTRAIEHLIEPPRGHHRSGSGRLGSLHDNKHGMRALSHRFALHDDNSNVPSRVFPIDDNYIIKITVMASMPYDLVTAPTKILVTKNSSIGDLPKRKCADQLLFFNNWTTDNDKFVTESKNIPNKLSCGEF